MAHHTRSKHLLERQGQSVWQDDITRDMLSTGTAPAADRGDRHPRPHLEPDDLREGDRRRQRLRRADHRDLLRRRTRAPPRSSRRSRSTTSATPAISSARSTTQSNGGDGFVSIEVSPEPGPRHATARSSDARRLWSAVDRPNLMVKIPGTDGGRAGHRGDAGRGDQHQHHPPLLARHLRAGRQRLRRGAGAAARRAGKPIDRIASVASFFVSRVDTAVDKLLDEKIAAASRQEAAGAEGQGRRRQRQARLREVRGDLRRRRASRRWPPAGAQGRSARSGPAPAPRTRPTATCSTSTR